MWNIKILNGLLSSPDTKSSCYRRLLFIMTKRFKSQTAETLRKERTSLTRALEHYDDFYSSVYGQKWPSLRLALLTTPKYMAVPNTFIDNTIDISTILENLGGFDVKKLWENGHELILKKLKSNEKEIIIDLNENDDDEETIRLEEMDKTLVSYAQTKVAEEYDILYQNAPEKKLPVRATEGIYDDRRVLKDIRDASQEYVTSTKMKGMEEFQLESEYFTSYGQGEEEFMTKDHSSFYKYTNLNNFTKIQFPTFLHPFCFESGNPNCFPASGKNLNTGLRDYLCINGASLAPIIALNMKLDTNVLDLCAGPGTKSLLMLMTMCPGHLTCNDLESSRLGRIKRIFQEFLGNGEPEHVRFTKYSGAKYPISPEYHRVLVDVPCTSDRISLTIQDNNIFKTQRQKERLGIVQLQKQILLSGFKCLSNEFGSTCVYSTCTLSPIENDGVVAAALKENDVQNLAVDLIGLWNALVPLQASRIFHMSRTKFGVMIEPNVISNFGPMYISRIVVVSPTT